MEYIFNMQEDFFSDSFRIWIRMKQNGKMFQGKLVFEEIQPGFLRDETLQVPIGSTFPDQMKQALKAMGRLHFADEATLKAKDYHLEDMRRLVFKTGGQK